MTSSIRASPALAASYRNVPVAAVPAAESAIYVNSYGHHLPYWCKDGTRFRMVTPAIVSEDAKKDPTTWNATLGNSPTFARDIGNIQMCDTEGKYVRCVEPCVRVIAAFARA